MTTENHDTHYAIGRMEGKIDTLVSLASATNTRLDNLEDRQNAGYQRLSALEAKVESRSDSSRFWLTTLVALGSMGAAAASLPSIVKEFFK